MHPNWDGWFIIQFHHCFALGLKLQPVAQAVPFVDNKSHLSRCPQIINVLMPQYELCAWDASRRSGGCQFDGDLGDIPDLAVHGLIAARTHPVGGVFQVTWFPLG